MSLTLYDLTIPNYLQTLEALDGILEKAQSYCTDNGKDPDVLLKQRLTADMRPLSFQLHMAMYHSEGALQGIKAGVFTPPQEKLELRFGEFRQRIEASTERLRNLPEHDINDLAGRRLVFKLTAREIPFTAERFVQSFSLPNLYFHATTAYAILRMEGVPLGKMDFLGQLRLG